MKYRSYISIAVAAGMFGFTPFVFSQKTFDEYFKMVKAHQIGQREVDFLKQCPIDPEGVPVYGVRLDVIRGERWGPRPLLGKGIEERFGRDYYTAEIREAVGGKARFINIWWVTRDTGESQNVMYCLNDAQKVEVMQTLNIYDPPGGGAGVRYLRREHVNLLGKSSEVQGTFVDSNDIPVPEPKLSKRDLASAKVPASTEDAYGVLSDLWGKMRPKTMY